MGATGAAAIQVAAMGRSHNRGAHSITFGTI